MAMVALEVPSTKLQFEVRNTFLTFSQGCFEIDNEDCFVSRRRAFSEPPQTRWGISSESERAADDGLKSAREQATGPSPNHNGGSDHGAPVGSTLTQQEAPGSSDHPDQNVANHERSRKKTRKGQRNKDPRPWANWWREKSCSCPLSKFPISLLPFPPFKLRSNSHSSEEYVLIDGQFLVFQVLSTWEFNVLGIQLSEADIHGLDLYMKRCKLGGLRIGDAVALEKAMTPEALQELSSVRQLAKQKLEQVKEIKRLRMARCGSLLQPSASNDDSFLLRTADPNSLFPQKINNSGAEITSNFCQTPRRSSGPTLAAPNIRWTKESQIFSYLTAIPSSVPMRH